MYSTFLSVALFALPVLAQTSSFAINRPALTQCQNSTISWDGTKSEAPYNLIVVAADNRCGDALVEIGDFNKTSTRWQVALAAGTEVELSLIDANDLEAWSGKITIGASDDDSCLPGRSLAPSSTHASSSAASTASASGTPAPTVPVSNAASDPAAADNGSAAGIIPVGAANAANPLFGSNSAAINARQASAPAIAITALAAIFALSL